MSGGKNMKKILVVIGIVVLFVGVSVVSSMNSDVETANEFDEIGNLNHGTEIFYPTDDAFIKPETPNGNHGTSDYMHVRNDYGLGGSSGWASDILIRFDISSVPSDAYIISAVLTLYYYQYYDNNPAGRDLNLYRATSDWDEEIVTWNTQPTYASLPSDYSTVPSSTDVWMEWDVTNDVEDFVSGSYVNYGWKVTDENYWGQDGIPKMFFRTREYGSFIPYLEIDVLEPHMAFLFGRIENLNTEGDLTTFDAVRLRYLQFSPFSFNTYISGEEIAVVGSGLGIITTSFAFGFFSAALL